MELGDYDQAISDLNRVIEISPDDADAYYVRGYTYLQLGDCDQVIADFNRGIEMAPDHPDVALAFYFRGKCHLEIGEKLKAVSDLEQAIGLGLPLAHKQEAEALLMDLKP